MVWLAEDLRQRGKGLRAGDVVAAGLISDVVEAQPGARVRAEFGSIGSVELVVMP